MLNKTERRLLKFIGSIFLITILIGSNLFGQNSSSFMNKINNYDLSSVFNPDSITDDGIEKYKRPEILGYIDTTFQRFQIHFISLKKDKSNPYKYDVSGKTKVKDNICSFIGTITVIAATYDTSSLMTLIGFPKYKGGFITGQVLIYEDKNQIASGSIKGELKTEIYFDDKEQIHYSALFLVADGFSNNQFEGNWTSYKSGITKKCNWGDFRIPDSNGFDGGTGEFIPMEKYLVNGWQNYYDYLKINAVNENEPKSIEVKRIEETEWWK
jgi:hypothetical protein